MKKAAALLMVLFLAMTMYAQEDQMSEEQAAQAEAMQAWTEFMTPGEMQEKLAAYEGEWNVESTFWYGPDSEPMTTEGSATAEMILGGRYLRTNHSGNYMGMPFEGISLEGYDKALDKFVTVWIDNFGTGMMYAEGHIEDGMVVYEGEMTDPMIKEAVWFKQTMEHVDSNNSTLIMYAKDPEGTVYKNMEIKFTRK